jgi:hypothetical protein
MSGHVPQRDGYCKQPRKFLKPTGYLWQCNCGRVYRLSEVISVIDHGREWREVYDGDFRKMLSVSKWTETVR